MTARARLVNTADVKIIVNGDASQPIVSPAGSTLLNTSRRKRFSSPRHVGVGYLRSVQGPRERRRGSATSHREKSHFGEKNEKAAGCPAK